MSTCRQIRQEALFGITNLQAHGNFKNDTALYNDLAKISGLSTSLVRQFHQGTSPNLSADNLDKLVAAIKTAQRRGK